MSTPEYIVPSDDNRELHQKRSTYTAKESAKEWLAALREQLLEQDEKR